MSNVWNLFKIDNKNTGKNERQRFDIFILNFEQISHIALLFLMLTLAGRWNLAFIFE